ncbi:unnamed protein product [Rotaria socialis]|uniref:Uncharacterized protein n=1 Tax=Rotaria socialis TaxID=392032 RepID=A0A817ZPD9_9BILA|nr:unnamed protein product [Rotaria socialis]
MNLTANSSSLTITKAILAVEQIDPMSVVSINETFNISIAIVDTNVSLHNLPEYHANGTLITTNSSSIIIGIARSSMVAANLMIDTIGVYLIKVQLASSNNDYVFSLVANAVLVKKKFKYDYLPTIDQENDFPTSNITFSGDYDALILADLLDIKRTIIDNFLMDVGMPITSAINVTKGNIVASSAVGTDTTGLAAAVQSITADPKAISDLTALSININGNTYKIYDSSSDTSNQSSSPKTIMIITIVVCIVGSVVILFGAHFGIKKYEIQHKRRRLIHNLTEQSANGNGGIQYDENIATKIQTEERNNDFQLKEKTSSSMGNSPKNTNQVQPLVNKIEKIDRPQSSSVSVSMLTLLQDDHANPK